MNKTGIRLSALCLCTAMLSANTMPAWAQDNGDTKEDEKNAQENAQEKVSETVSEKEETVYVKLNADGTKKEVIVSDWLKNPDGMSVVEDMSDLMNIETVKGKSESSVLDDGTVLWSSSGSDVYYQGTTDKELPVSVKATYYLDGKEISPKDLAGKSGKIKIRYDYTNTSLSEVEINGEKETIATPFAVVTGMILPDNFTNVSVTNGKVISDGSKTIVAGVAFPGLADSLRLSESTLAKNVSLPSYVEITADAQDFELTAAASLVTNSLFEDADIEEIKSEEDLESLLDDFSEAALLLADGGDELAEGTDTFKTAVNTLTEATGLLKDGVSKLKDGSKTLQDGVAAYTAGADILGSSVYAYTDGVAQLTSGLDTYVNGAAALTDGIGTLSEQTKALPGAVSSLNDGIIQIKNGADALTSEETAGALVKGSAQMTESIGQLHDAIAAIKTSLEAAQSEEAIAANIELAVQALTLIESNDQTVLETLQSVKSVENKVAAVKDVAPEAFQNKINELETQYTQALDQSIALLGQNLAMVKQLKVSLAQFGDTSDMETLMTALTTLEAATSPENDKGLYVASKQLNAGISAWADGANTLKEGIAKEAEGVAALSNASGALMGGIDQLNSGAAQLSAANGQLKAGASQLNTSSAAFRQGALDLTSNSAKLNSGALELFNGLNTLDSKVTELNNKMPELTDGVNTLCDGAHTLSEGIHTFNSEGVEKLCAAYEDDVKAFEQRVEAVVNAGKDYEIFSQLGQGQKGSVKFIMEMESIKKD